MRAIKPKPPGAALCPSVLRVGGGQRLGRRAPTGFILEIEIAARLPLASRTIKQSDACRSANAPWASRRDLEGLHAAITRAGFAW
jgi:hypothetical protein